MRLISLFSGCGGLDLGFKQAGFEIPVANEYDSAIYETFRYNHPDTRLIEGDIRKVNEEVFSSVGEIDGIIGGPPCQSWSCAGSQRGIDDKRGQLFYDYIRILKAVQPKFFLAENVTGMLSKKHRDAVQNILSMFEDAGYHVSLHTVNAKDYHTPQERKRVFYIGIRKDIPVSFVFPSPSEDILTLQDAIADLEASAVPALEHNRHNPDAVNQNEYYTGGFSPIFMSRNRVRAWNEPGFTVQAMARQCQLHPSAPAMVKMDTDKFSFVDGYTYRRLTLRECARLQGFPDTFQFLYERLEDGYKMVGNAVPVSLAYAVASAIRQQLFSPAAEEK